MIHARCAAVALAATLLSCVPYGTRPSSPALGGRPWVEVSSPRFHLYSDLSAAETGEIAQQLEQGVDAIERVAFERSRAALEPTNVVVFSDISDFHAFMPELRSAAFYSRLPGDLEPSRFMILHGALSDESRITCLHELTHVLFERNFGPAPPWLSEGWAEYYSTIRIEPGHLKVGAALPRLTFTSELESFEGRAPDRSPVFAMAIDEIPTTSELLRLDREAFYESSTARHAGPSDGMRAAGLYLGSWALVHMLHDGPEPYPSRYAQFLQSARSSTVDAAWRSAFGGLSDADFDRDFRAYLAKREIAVFDLTSAPSAEAPLVTRALTDAEVRVLWARLPSQSPDSSAAAMRDLNQAVSEAPQSADARYFRGIYWYKQHRLAEAEMDFSTAAQLAPNDPRCLLGMLLLRRAERPKNTRPGVDDPVLRAAAALARVASSPVQLSVLGDTYGDLGDFQEALVYAKRAVELAPIGAEELDTEARIQAALGNFDEALTLEHAAVAFLPETESSFEILVHLAKIEQLARSKSAH